MQFITLVQLRPAGASTEIGSRVAARAAQWQHLQHQIQLVGGRVDQIWNVLGNDYDLMFVGEADDPKTLHRVDAICKAEGYMSKTHPAIKASRAIQYRWATPAANMTSISAQQQPRQKRAWPRPSLSPPMAPER